MRNEMTEKQKLNERTAVLRWRVVIFYEFLEIRSTLDVEKTATFELYWCGDGS